MITVIDQHRKKVRTTFVYRGLLIASYYGTSRRLIRIEYLYGDSKNDAINNMEPVFEIVSIDFLFFFSGEGFEVELKTLNTGKSINSLPKIHILSPTVQTALLIAY
jgi:hypothetical protein